MGPWGRIVENISSKLAFFPPQPATYAVREHADGTGDLYLQPLAPDIPKVLQCRVKVIPVPPTKRGGGNTQVVTAFFPYGGGATSSRSGGGGAHTGRSGAGAGAGARSGSSTSSSSASRLTLLYSHGNAVDLGHMLPVYRELSRLLRVNVMAYDYSGYGCSSGTPTVNNTLADITAVLQCLADAYGIPASRVVLYGQSVGSGPSCYLAAQRPDLAGVVLHSPLLSGVRVLKPHVRWWPSWADVYPNHTLAPRIQAPVLVMHGTEDEVIHISCGKKLLELCPNKATPLWAAGYGHQDLEMCAAYLPTLEAFLAKVAQPAASSSSAPSSSADLPGMAAKPGGAAGGAGAGTGTGPGGSGSASAPTTPVGGPGGAQGAANGQRR